MIELLDFDEDDEIISFEREIHQRFVIKLCQENFVPRLFNDSIGPLSHNQLYFNNIFSPAEDRCMKIMSEFHMDRFT